MCYNLAHNETTFAEILIKLCYEKRNVIQCKLQAMRLPTMWWQRR